MWQPPTEEYSDKGGSIVRGYEYDNYDEYVHDSLHVHVLRTIPASLTNFDAARAVALSFKTK